MNYSFPYKSILVVCSVNTARSPIVQGYLTEFFKNLSLNVDVNSCGVASNARDGMLISLDAKLVMKEEGINLPENAKSIDLKKHKDFLKNADLILTLTEQHKREIINLNGLKKDLKERILTLRGFAGENGDIEDPSMKGIDGFRKTRKEIKKCLIKGLKTWFPEDIVLNLLSNQKSTK